MCLAVPAQVLSVEPDFYAAEVDIMGNKKTVSIALTPEVKEGEWVLVHAGQAISVVSEHEAHDSLKLWEEILNDESGA